MSNSVFTTINPKTNKEITIRLERVEERFAVENLVRESFWNVYRPCCLEHYVMHQLREEAAFVPELDLVMELDGQLIGQVLYMRSAVILEDGATLPVVTFGPIGIAPEYKHQGYGLIVLGKSVGITYADDSEADYFIVKELEPGFLAKVKGVYRDPAGYFVDEAEAEAFDKQFPPKAKQKLPGQLW